jgi:lysophospholipase L1-like esterase
MNRRCILSVYNYETRCSLHKCAVLQPASSVFPRDFAQIEVTVCLCRFSLGLWPELAGPSAGARQNLGGFLDRFAAGALPGRVGRSAARSELRPSARRHRRGHRSNLPAHREARPLEQDDPPAVGQHVRQPPNHAGRRHCRTPVHRGNLLAGKAQQVLFRGKPEVVIPVGEELYSDEVALDIDPADPLLEGHNLAVSFFVKGASGPLTWHCDAFYTSYLTAPGNGDHTRDKDEAAFPFTTTSWFLLDAVEAQADPDTAVVCAFGDSITEVVNSTLNGSDTWPDVLSRRLHSAYGNKIAVVKEAISGNTVTSCPRSGGTSVNGPSAGDRLDRDVFGVAGLRYVIWLEGINDLGACLVSADQVIQGYKDVVERLHAKKIKVIGATVVSSFGSPIGSYGFPKIDTERKKINDFIRIGGLFDAVADFDAATLDPATGAMKAPMQPNDTTGGPGELLHPNRVGYQAMAETIDIKTLAPGPSK